MLRCPSAEKRSEPKCFPAVQLASERLAKLLHFSFQDSPITTCRPPFLERAWAADPDPRAPAAAPSSAQSPPETGRPPKNGCDAKTCGLNQARQGLYVAQTTPCTPGSEIAWPHPKQRTPREAKAMRSPRHGRSNGNSTSDSPPGWLPCQPAPD